MDPIIIERGQILLGVILLGVAAGQVSQEPAVPTDGLAAPPPVASVAPADPVTDLAAALRAADESTATMAVYSACRQPPDVALQVAAETADDAPALSRIVRDCALPPAEAIRELEALIEADDALAAVAVLELHRLGANDSPALQAIAERDPGLAGWLAAYSRSGPSETR